VQRTPEFILYSRSTCSLCEAIEEELIPYIQRYRISIERRYVDNDDALEQQYGARVPVLTVSDEAGDRVLCEYHLDEAALLQAIGGHVSHDDQDS
jgi:hypothetical protein